MSIRRGSRRGSMIVLLLVVVLIVGLLMQQTVRTFSVLRGGHDQQTRIDQANQLLELGFELDQQDALPAKIQAGATWIIPIGTEFGRLEAMEMTVESETRRMWLAKIPVDANGFELPSIVSTKVSCERSK